MSNDVPARSIALTGRARGMIANAMVRIMREHVGRGPTRARATVSEGLVTVVLADTLTPPERLLVASGRYDLLAELNQEIGAAIRPMAIAAVEAGTGGEVVAMTCGHDFDPDVVTLVFVLASALHPEG
jgi:uncharacterized protein YbcI